MLLCILQLLCFVTVARPEDALPTIEWPEEYYVVGEVIDKDRTYLINNFASSKRKYYGILEWKEKHLEKGQFTQDKNNYILFVDEFKCIKTDEKPAYTAKSVENLYKTVVGDGLGWNKKDDCYERKQNNTEMDRICYKNITDIRARGYLLPVEFSSQLDGIRFQAYKGYSIGYKPIFPPEWSYCDGLANKPSFEIDFPRKADLFMYYQSGEKNVAITLMFDPFERYAGIDYDEQVYQGNSGRFLFDLYEGYAFNIFSKAKTCEISAIDLKHEMLSNFIYVGNDSLSYEIRDKMKIFEYHKDKVQIFDLGFYGYSKKRRYRLNTMSNDGKIMDLYFEFDPDSAEKDTPALLEKHIFDTNTKQTQKITNIFQTKGTTFLANYSPVHCYVQLESSQPDCKIEDLGITWQIDDADSKKFNLDSERDNIRRAILSEFLTPYNKFVRKHRYLFNSRVSVNGPKKAVFGTTVMPRVPTYLRYATRPHVDFKGKMEAFPIPQDMDKVLASCIYGCERRFEKKKDCFGVYFQKIGTTEVACDLITETFDPDSLKPLPDQDFTVAFRPFRPETPGTTTEAFFDELVKISGSQENLVVLPVLDISGKPKFNIILSEVIKGDVDEDDAAVESVDLLTHGTILNNNFIFSNATVEIASDAITTYYGSTYLEDCAQACLKNRRNEGLCDVFDFHTLTGECRFGVVNSHVQFNYSEDRWTYLYTGFGMILESDNLVAVPPVAEKVADNINLLQCNSLCVENSDKFLPKGALVHFPRDQVCTNYVFDSNTGSCYFMPSSMGHSRSSTANANTVTQHFLDMERNFVETAAFEMDAIPSDWVNSKPGEKGNTCADNCFRDLKNECAKYVECSHQTDYNHLCFVFSANVTFSDYLEADTGKAYVCKLKERGLRTPRATVYHVTSIDQYWHIMPTVGLVFLAIFMFIVGASLAVLVVKLVKR